MQKIIQIALATTLVVGVSGCSMLPGSGPREQNIHENSKASSRNDNATLGYDYVVVDLTSETLPFITQDTQEEFQTFGIRNTEPPAIRLGPGDVVRVTVFESETGGLFLPQDAGARPGNFVQLPTQRVDQAGRITVPFAGNVQAAGRTPAEVERIIRDRLQDRAIQPEISVEVMEQNFSRVSIMGAVREPTVLTLREGGLRVLEAISSAGSISGPASSSFVVLQRGNQNAKVAYRNIANNASENIFLAPGDVIEIVEEDKGYFAFGATGLVGKFNFGSEQVNLNDAVARIASLQDNQADPGQVLIYRKESRHALEQMGIDFKDTELYGELIPTIFRANYRAPDIFFLASEFNMRDGDVIFVTNAAAIEFQRFFNNATSLTGSPLQVRTNIEAF